MVYYYCWIIVIFIYFGTSKKCIEIVVSWIPDFISEFQNRSILMLFLEASDWYIIVEQNPVQMACLYHRWKMSNKIIDPFSGSTKWVYE